MNDVPVSGYLMAALIHDNVDLFNKPIIGWSDSSKTPNCTPFQVRSRKSPNSTIYTPFTIDYIGGVYGAVVPLNGEEFVDFHFPMLSSDPQSKFCRSFRFSIHKSSIKILIVSKLLCFHLQILAWKRKGDRGPSFFTYHLRKRISFLHTKWSTRCSSTYK